MKVGILTFQYAINYGAVLQMYALKNHIESLGHSVEIINYVPGYYKENSIRDLIRNAGFSKSRLNRPVVDVLKRLFLSKRYSKQLVENFHSFLSSNFCLSARCDETSWPVVVSQYDCVVVGSDQVWNPSNRNKSIYFLETDEVDLSCIKVSYAADSTWSNVNESDIGHLRLALDSFDAISVRNMHSAEFVKKITGREPFVVCDPVVFGSFSSLVNDHVRKIKEKYIFVYVLGDEISGGNDAAILRLRSLYPKSQVVQVVMPFQRNYSYMSTADMHIWNCSPDEWVSLIANAECVYTDSFHCALLSTMFRRPLVVFYADEKRAPRILDLESRYNLSGSVVSSAKELSFATTDSLSSYTKTIDDLLEKSCADGKSFLKRLF